MVSATTHPTLLDLASRLDPDDTIADVVEMLDESTDIVKDMVIQEGNLITGYQSVQRTEIPVPTWRGINQLVQPTKSATVKIVDTCGMLEAYAEVDKAEADFNNNSAQWMLSEHQPHLEGIAQKMSDSIIAGDLDVDPKSINGLRKRYSASASGSTETSDNVIDGGGSTSNSMRDIWLCCWGPNSMFGIVPKGSKTGIQVTNLGRQTRQESGGMMEVYRTHYRVDIGLHVRNWHAAAVRIANVNAATLTKTGSTGADIIDLMTQALEVIKNPGLGRCVFYLPRLLRSFLRRQIANKVASSTLTEDKVAGKTVMFFDDIPVRRLDALDTAYTTKV